MRNILKPLLAIKTKRGYSILSAVVVTLFSTWVIFDATKFEVDLTVNGETEVVKTHGKTAGELLEEVGIDVGVHDFLSHNVETPITDGMEIEYKEALKVFLTVDDETKQYYTIAATVGEFFNLEQLEFNEHDEISHDLSAKLTEGLEITVDTAFQITVIDGEKKAKHWTTGGNVEDFLVANDISLNKLDKIKPKLDKEITEDTKITIIRVEKKEKEVEESIPFEVEERKDNSLEAGKKKVIKAGKKGKALNKYEVTYENGKEVDRKLISEKVLEKSEKEIVAVGTKKAASASSAPAGKGKVMVMEATGYGADCKGCSGITAIGINLKKNPNMKVISVDPRIIPLGSRVWVEGYGEAIAGDTGGAIKGNRIDVFLPSEAYARNNWGRRTVKVKILD